MLSSRVPRIRRSDRNRLILQESRVGLNYRHIARQHNLSETRVRTIIEAESKRERFEQDMERVRRGTAYASILLSPTLRAAIAKSLGTPDFGQEEVDTLYRGNFISLLKEQSISTKQLRELESWIAFDASASGKSPEN